MVHASLFSGIGGPEIAAEMMGWENAFHCEINPFCRTILNYWFPDARSYEDITKTDFREWRGRIDVLTGGFPCQPFSTAGRRGGQTITATYGRKCAALLTKSGPLGLLVKTLLESQRWLRTGGLLKWETSILYSMRTTIFEDTDTIKPLPSNEFAKTLKVSDMRSNRLLFRLRPLMRHTGGIESSSSPLMQTPTAVMTCESPEKMRARAERKGYKNGTKYGSLESQIMFDPRFRELLPTPTARDEKNPSSPNGKRIKRKIKQGYTIELNDLAAMGLLPTPCAHDAIGRTNPGQVKKSGAVYGETLSDTIYRLYSTKTDGNMTIKDGSPRLSPLFSEEIMGFPFLWTAFPFLRQDGEPNP